MKTEDMLNCLSAVADYMSEREESPRCARDLREIAKTFTSLQSENAELTARLIKLEDELNDYKASERYNHQCASDVKSMQHVISKGMCSLDILEAQLQIMEEEAEKK